MIKFVAGLLGLVPILSAIYEFSSARASLSAVAVTAVSARSEDIRYFTR